MRPELRVALFSGNYCYHPDGANKALNRLVAHLERRGGPTLVFSPTARTPAFQHEGTLISIPSVSLPGRREYRLGLPLSADRQADLNAFSPTLVHLSAPDWLNHSALSYAERMGIPAVASFHTRFDTYLEYYGLGRLVPQCKAVMSAFYDRCDEVFVPSTSMADTLWRDGIVRRQTRSWSRGVERKQFSPRFRDEEWRRAQGFEPDDVVVAFVGRLVREKGLAPFADMIDALKGRGLPIRSLIVGDGPERKAIARRLPDAVMTGYLDGSHLARAYASSDLFVNPSLTETFGNVTLEAMASGTVPICVNATGSACLVEHERTGLLVEQADGRVLADAAASLIADPGRQARLAAAARTASAAYGWDEILDGVLDTYREVLARAEDRAIALTRKAG